MVRNLFGKATYQEFVSYLRKKMQYAERSKNTAPAIASTINWPQAAVSDASLVCFNIRPILPAKRHTWELVP